MKDTPPDTLTSTETSSMLQISCSFCLRGSEDVAKVVEGAGAYICDECIHLCVSILEADSAQGSTASSGRADHHGPDLPGWSELDDEQLLRRLPRIASVGDQVQQALRAWVGEARRRQLSWSQIGAHLGISRQSAWERFTG